LKKVLLIIFPILIVDQVFKFWVKLNMRIGQEFNIIGERIKLYFIENNGMAFGMQFAGDAGKLILTAIRIIAVILILFYLFQITKRKTTKTGLIVCLSLIVAGALGNIIDSVFYGVIFSESTPVTVATLLPDAGGYASFFHGKVVDMLYCPIIRSTYPDWFPFVGGQNFEFFRPIFNVADSAITIGMFWLLIGYKRFFPNHK
jgi:signal peptidase II